MNIRGSELIVLEECGTKYKFNKLGVVTHKGKEYYLSIVMKRIIKYLLSLSKKDFSLISPTLFEYIYDALIFSEITDDLFTPLAKGEILKELAEKIERFILYMKDLDIMAFDITQDVKINDRLITITADLILRNKEGNVEVIKLKRNAPKLSYSARKDENKPENNLELFLLQKLGEHLYPEEEVFGSFYHITSKKDNETDNLAYELKKGYNIIRYSFKDEESNGIKARISKFIEQIDLDKFDSIVNSQECQICPYVNICEYKKPQKIDFKEIKEINKAPENFELTETQRSIVFHDEGILRVNAGAGSGKTTVVALRVVELILAGCKPEDILLITFTNKGAAEMKEKIAYWLKKEGKKIDLNKFNITTFNSWGNDIIQKKYKLLGFTKHPKLIEKIEKYDILFDLLKSNPKLDGYDYKNPLMNFRYAKGVVVELENIFNYIKAYSIMTPEELSDKVCNKEQIMSLYKEYNKILIEKNLIEYQDQINLLISLIENNPGELKEYNYKHIIVDEFQDSEKIQLDLILFLTGQSKFKSLMIVGDDAQSVFGFRNVSPENILNFHIYFDNIEDINMTETFRSTPEITALANAINNLNSEKTDKKLISNLKNNKMPELIFFNSYEEEYLFIAKKIKILLNENKPEDFAIIARTKAELFSIEEYLKEENIPYVIDIPEPLINNTNVHIARTFSIFLDNLRVTQGLFEYLYVVTDKFKDMSKEEIKNMIREETDKIREIIEKDEDGALSVFYDKLGKIEDKDFQGFLLELKDRNYSFKQLKSYLNKFIEYRDEKTIEIDNTKYEAITLTTAHTSKGKEFKIVFNTISKYKADKNDKAIDEERRVLFVALTRAKERLYITTQDNLYNKANKSYNRFNKEIEGTGLCRKDKVSC